MTKKMRNEIMVTVNGTESENYNSLISRNFVINGFEAIDITEQELYVGCSLQVSIDQMDGEINASTGIGHIRIFWDSRNQLVSCYNDLHLSNFDVTGKSAVIMSHVNEDGSFSDFHVEVFYSFEEAMDWANQYMEDTVRKPA